MPGGGHFVDEILDKYHMKALSTTTRGEADEHENDTG
jgi:hypothetical protein